MLESVEDEGTDEQGGGRTTLKHGLQCRGPYNFASFEDYHIHVISSNDSGYPISDKSIMLRVIKPLIYVLHVSMFKHFSILSQMNHILKILINES